MSTRLESYWQENCLDYDSRLVIYDRRGFIRSVIGLWVFTKRCLRLLLQLVAFTKYRSSLLWARDAESLEAFTLISTPFSVTSVTRFAEISPLWQTFTSLWKMFDGVFLIWQNSKPTLANMLHYWANFHCYK